MVGDGGSATCIIAAGNGTNGCANEDDSDERIEDELRLQINQYINEHRCKLLVMTTWSTPTSSSALLGNKLYVAGDVTHSICPPLFISKVVSLHMGGESSAHSILHGRGRRTRCGTTVLFMMVGWDDGEKSALLLHFTARYGSPRSLGSEAFNCSWMSRIKIKGGDVRVRPEMLEMGTHRSPSVTRSPNIASPGRLCSCSLSNATSSSPNKMSRPKRKLEDFDPTASDPEDEDYGAASSPRAKPRPKNRKSQAQSSRKPPKRRRDRYGGSDDDIELDSDEISEEEEDFAVSSDAGQEVEVNPRTGRGVRSVAKKPVTYEEPSEDEVSSASNDSDEIKLPQSRSNREEKRSSKKLLVRLKVPHVAKMDIGVGSGHARPSSSRSMSKHEPTPQASSAVGTRRSSRISHDEQAPLVALTDSGKHEQVTRAATATPEPPALRPTRGAKGLRNLPSAIMEVSQEDEPAVIQSQELATQLQEAAERTVNYTSVAHTSPGLGTVNDDEIIMERVDDDEQVVEESMDEDDEEPVAKRNRPNRAQRKASTPPPTAQYQGQSDNTRRSLRGKKSEVEPSSDFEPDAEGEADIEENFSSSDDLLKPPRGRSSNDESQGGGRRSGRLARKTASQRSRSNRQPSDDEELDPEEIADEAAELDEDNRRNRRSKKRPAARSEIAYEPVLRNRGKKPDYRILRPELIPMIEDDDSAIPPAATPSRNRRGGGGGAYRSLFSTFGPFGGAGGLPPVLGGLDNGAAATGGVDSDSSDDEAGPRGAQGMGGTVGMTPTSGAPKPFALQAHNDPVQGPGGGPPGLGLVKSRKALADADPLGVDPNVSFDGVGGLDDHIDRLKEMVALPLLYPEVFQRFKVTPPRGVLFHGPPGTGKTLLARALASSVSSGGKKVTFYMRKGADALSKWVGEAEKQLRLLFEEARKNQPSIIFFDEIDGLAPVRSSKQEQIHASIVATLLALMDGMDGRGQVIVIGATNRPDSVDPALRRPGRFDREFYFPLPEQKARRAIIDIHTKNWEPPLQAEFKDQLAEITRGYGGADLRALCTEAALNAVQGTYPQIYTSNEKLVIDPSTIKVLAKDFMISVKKMVPSSERSASSGAAPLKKDVEPLLRKPLAEISNLVDQAIPRKRNATALEEAMYDDRDDENGFARENMARQFESSRVFRPRLLVRGEQGNGQQYLGAALLSKLEGLHVQNFDMPTLMKDSTRSVEAAIVQQFEEVKRHKPGVIYIPNVDLWYQTLADSAIRTFTGLLRGLGPTEPVLLLGIMDREPDYEDEKDVSMLRDLFGYSMKNQFVLDRPDVSSRSDYFDAIRRLVRTSPAEFPEPQSRKRRKLAELPVAHVEEAPKGPTKEELKAQKKKDRQTLNMLKLGIQPVMDQVRLKYKKFRTGVIDDSTIGYLYDEQDPEKLSTDLDEAARQQQQLFRPYELDRDDKGVSGLREVASGKFYYNLDIVTIEKRLSNGYYKRPKDFLADIKRLAKDAKAFGDQDRTLKANEMLANVEVDMGTIETTQPALVAECEAVFEREQQRETERLEKIREAERRGVSVPKVIPNVPPQAASKTTTETSGPVYWGTTNGSHPSNHTNGSTVPSRPQEDSEMPDSQPDPHEWPNNSSPGQQNTQGQRSQKSAHTQLAHGSQLDQYQNSASTTTSGNKTSDKSGRSSGPFSLATDASNGVRNAIHPLSNLGPASGASQLPDTQEVQYPSSQSQPASQSSPHMAPPAAPIIPHRSSIAAVLNDPGEAAPTEEDNNLRAQQLVLDTNFMDQLHNELVRRSSGLSVEQLEQVNAGLMNVIWEMRSEWNRNKLLRRLQDTFNEIVEDIEACQKIMDPSQKTRKAGS
nr:tat-binding like 7 [Quercus suber]